MTDNRSRCLSGIDTSVGRGLEIGALDRPLLPWSPGRIFTADHSSTEALREKYAHDPAVSKVDIRAVDFDLSRMPLTRAAQSAGFDYVVASHVIEHVPDLVGWLGEIETILNVGGRLALAIPDRRFTFDYFRRETTLWMVQEAIGRKRPDAETVLDFMVNVVAADAGLLWADPGSQRDMKKLVSADTCNELMARHAGGEYIDVHCWVFTPESFSTLIMEIIKKNRLQFQLTFLEPTSSNQLEFYAQLTKVRPNGFL